MVVLLVCCGVCGMSALSCHGLSVYIINISQNALHRMAPFEYTLVRRLVGWSSSTRICFILAIYFILRVRVFVCVFSKDFLNIGISSNSHFPNKDW